MPQIAPVLALLTFVVCDTLVQLSSQPIEQVDMLIHTAASVYYRTHGNNFVRRRAHGLSEMAEIPKPLHKYSTRFVEIANDTVIIHGLNSPASLPIYWLNDVEIKEYNFYKNYSMFRIYEMKFIESNNANYVLSLLTSFEDKAYTEYALISSCLDTGESYHVISGVSVYPTVNVHVNGIVSMMYTTLDQSTVFTFDPTTRTITNIDTWFNASPRSPLATSRSLIYQYVHGTVKRYDVLTNATEMLEVNATMTSLKMLASREHSERFMLGSLSTLSLICEGFLNQCTSVDYGLWTTHNVYLQSKDLLVYIPNDFMTKMLSVSLTTGHKQTLCTNLRVQSEKGYQVAFMKLQYHEPSNSILFVGVDFSVFSSIDLFRLDLKTQIITLVTRLCEEKCTLSDYSVFIKNETITVIRVVDSEYHLFELQLGEVSDPKIRKGNKIKIWIVFLGGVFGVLTSILIVVFVLIRWLKRRSSYEMVNR